ncbi:MAG: hypothetical protein INR62_08195 [Rhodospirillales bacterium]|nr:hypothetical protein [Acetobacter sp.]
MTKVFHLANVGSPNEANEIVIALRNVIDPTDKIFLLNSTNDVIISASAEELTHVGELIAELDKPKHAYRLTYTLTESDAGKRVGVQHFATLVLVGQHVVLKQGDKIPVVTGSYSTEKAAQQNQFTYLDVGINLDSTLDQFASGLRLRSKVEQSAVAQEHQTGMLADEPIVRQSVLEGTSAITPGKPTNLGGIDIVGSTRHLDIEVVVEALS